jgi:hypothetical protein
MVCTSLEYMRGDRNQEQKNHIQKIPRTIIKYFEGELTCQDLLNQEQKD